MQSSKSVRPPSNGQHIWPGRPSITNNNHQSYGGENEPPNVNQANNYDIFSDREGGGGMRVGRDFQAKIPIIIPKEERNVQAESEKALLVWRPNDKISEDEIEHYLSVARDKYQYSGEQALGLLYWHHYEVTKAIQDLGNFTPHPEEWTIEDKVLFEQAFQFHGKAFDRIRQMLPDKSMSSLIRYYYKWKKLRCKSSVMDRQAKKFREEDVDDPAGSPSSNPNVLNQNGNYNQLPQHISMLDSDSDDIIKHNGESGKICGNCGIVASQLCSEVHIKDSMCNTCFLYWKRTGEYRPLTGPLRRGDRQVLGILRQRRCPPRGMYINHDDLNMLASAPPQAENVTLQSLEKEVLEMKFRVQSTKQKIEMLQQNLPSDGIDKYRPKEVSSSSNRVNARWTQEELNLAAQGIRRYGKNFQKIAEVVGTKTEAHMKTFYANYRKRYGLDDLVSQHLNENSDDSTDTDVTTIRVES